MDHGGSWESSQWRLGFVSRICFLRVRLVSGVFSCLDGDISPSLSSASGAHGGRGVSILHLRILPIQCLS